MSNFWQRTLTGIVFVIVMAGSIYLGLAFWLFLLITTLGLWEFYKIIYGPGNLTAKIYGTTGGVVVYISVAQISIPSLRFIAGHVWADSLFYLLPAFLIVLGIELFRKHPDPLKNLSITALSWIYIAVPFGLAVVLDKKGGAIDKGEAFYLPFLILIFILVWCNDVFAYLIGRSIGKTSIAPHISPKKTIEGTAGGALVTMLAAWLLRGFMPFPYSISTGFVLALGGVVAIMGLLGDLIESKFKRQLDIKDSGNILPGHGGILDRFDSFIYIVPWVYLLTELAVTWYRR